MVTSPERPETVPRGRNFNPRLTSMGVPLVPGVPIVRLCELPWRGGCHILASPACIPPVSAILSYHILSKFSMSIPYSLLSI